MFFVLSKILFYAAMPITWVVLLLGYGVFARHKKSKRVSLVLGFAALLFFTNPFLANEALLWWEVPPKPIAELPEYEVGVLLTGITNIYRSPKDRVYFGKGADRLVHTLQLYRMGKIKKILISGGSGSITLPDAGEADELRDVLVLAQVPEEDIILEERSRNTHENALYSAQMLQKMQVTQPVLLITSAFHMRRSAACFRKQGVKFDTFSTDFHTIDRQYYMIDKLLIPQEDPFVYWQKLVREWVGYISYSVAGYI